MKDKLTDLLLETANYWMDEDDDSEQEELFDKPTMNSMDKKRTITVNYETWDEESLEIGETDDKGEDSVIDVELDEYDKDEGIDIATKACQEIWSKLGISYNSSTKDFSGIVEPSSSNFQNSYGRNGIWYLSITPDTDFRTDEITNYSFHLDGFTKDEEEEIYNKLKR
jgi:hypothetical protein